MFFRVTVLSTELYPPFVLPAPTPVCKQFLFSPEKTVSDAEYRAGEVRRRVLLSCIADQRTSLRSQKHGACPQLANGREDVYVT